MNKPSVIFMGSKPGAVVALSILLERGWTVRHVVTSKKINHSWVGGPSIEKFAKERGIKIVLQADLPKDEHVDFVISYMYRHLVTRETLSMAQRAAINFHAAPLPEYGGWAFYNLAILENANEYGCTCHYMDEGFDTGPLLKVKRFNIDAVNETAYSLERRAQQEMIRLFIDFCNIAETSESLPMEYQDKLKMRYLRQQEFESLKKIPEHADEKTIDRYARAFWYPPYSGAYIERGGEKIEVIPQCVKSLIAHLLHADALENLRNIADNYIEECHNDNC